MGRVPDIFVTNAEQPGVVMLERGTLSPLFAGPAQRGQS